MKVEIAIYDDPAWECALRGMCVTSADHIKTDPKEFELLMKRQEQYDKRAADFLNDSSNDRAGQGAFELHKRIMAEIDQLPYEEGGRK